MKKKNYFQEKYKSIAFFTWKLTQSRF